MGVGRPVLPSAFRSRTSEDTLSLGPEAPQPPSGSRTGRGALVATALALAAVLGLAACTGGTNSSPSPAARGTPAPATPAATPQTLSETGSSLMAPLFALWAPAYHSQAQIAEIRG
jgi:hypothetical protein